MAAMADLILSSSETQTLEKAAIEQGVEAESLMDSAGAGIADVILQRHPQPGLCIAYLGKGNNAGDAIVAASLLAKAGWEIWTRCLVADSDLQNLPKKKIAGLSACRIPNPLVALPDHHSRIILDGLLGLGSRPELSPQLRALTCEINALRRNTSASVYAMDFPTGIGETGIDRDAVVADLTVTIGFPKTALFRDEVTDAVGRILVVDLEKLTALGPKEPTHGILSGPASLRHLLPRRSFDSHKGTYGRVGIAAGSRGFVGASILCAEAAARSGSGLITLYVPAEIYDLVVPRIIPEIMVKPASDFRSILENRLDALAIGPGMGSSRRQEILDLIKLFPGPAVVDADGLNALSGATAILSSTAGPRLLTPHPGEMSRLWQTMGKTRVQIVREFTAEYPVALLLKGARTLVGQKGMAIAYNSSGSPGMATGGSGDVLTGVCGALLGRGLSPYDAGRFGAWLCGRAGELAAEALSEESMLPSDLFFHFGAAFRDLR
jgi:ADP-dependent NAD(P)H-hydrate dehydratase / NAD(P)H-hydrate epimerase